MLKGAGEDLFLRSAKFEVTKFETVIEEDAVGEFGDAGSKVAGVM